MPILSTYTCGSMDGPEIITLSEQANQRKTKTV